MEFTLARMEKTPVRLRSPNAVQKELVGDPPIIARFAPIANALHKRILL